MTDLRRMDEETAHFLIGEEGRRLLEETAALPGDAPSRVLALRKRGIVAERAAGAVEVAEARRRARSRFSDADRLFFTGDALAQATSPMLAAYHAENLAAWGVIADLGCGVGMDAIAFAEAGAQVLALERDPARLVFAQANAAARGVPEERIQFQVCDVTVDPWSADVAYWDPSRREGDRRISRHADRYEPPLTFLEEVHRRVKGGCVKLSPALPDDVLEGLSGRVEFLSEGRECKEACLWFGEVKGEIGEASFTAVMLPDRLTITPTTTDPTPTGPLGAFIHDPDPALVRCLGALSTVAATEGVHLVSPDDAYLTSDAPLVQSRLASSYRVHEVFPYKPRAVGEWLRAQRVGRLVVKKRHFPKEPDAVARELGLNGKGKEITLILVREGKGHRAVLCEPWNRTE